MEFSRFALDFIVFGNAYLERVLSRTGKVLTEDSRGDVSLSLALSKISQHAARVAGVPAGQIAIGQAADICIFDPATRWKVEAKALASQGKHTPFLGYELPGVVKATIVSGHIAFDTLP